MLVEAILSSVRLGGNVLIPIDPAGRVLELILMLEEKWAQRSLGSYQIVLLTNVAYNTLDFAKSHLEWMGDHVTNAFERKRENPFNTKFLTLCHSMDELNALPAGPKVVLASFGSLEAGPARHLFARWAEDKKNLVVLTSQPEPGSLTEHVALLDSKAASKKKVTMVLAKRVPLEGAELEDYESKRKSLMKKEPENAIMELLDVEDEVTDIKPLKQEAEPMDMLLGVTTVGAAQDANLRRRETLVEGFSPISTPHGPMFPDEVWESAPTDYGEEIDIEEFHRISQRNTTGSGASVPPQAIVDTTILDEAGVQKQIVEEEDIQEEIPTKIVSETLEVIVRATILSVDFEGKADGKSVRTLITQTSPRRVLIVHGSTKETKTLKDALTKSLPGVSIDTPDAGKTVDCTSASATYKIRLSDALFQKAKMRDMSGYKVGWINGVVGKALEEGGAPMLLPVTNSENHALALSSDVAMKKFSAQPGSVFLGDLRLSDFRQVLAQAGISAEFADGVLVCANGRVTVRKGGDDKLVVEGALSNEYFDIRSILYHQYQIL
jgi:cleavage and polyadenylation specificity factor subunit 2